jgi:uncharacterized membrane protein YfcA
MDATAAYVVVGAAVAGFVQGLSGFAFGLVAMAFWAWTIAPDVAGPMVVFGSLLGQLISIGSVRKSFSLARALPFIVGGVMGVPLGVALLKNIDPATFRLVVGIVLAVFCGFALLAPRLPRISAGGALADGGVGFLGGVMGGLGGLSGPTPTFWTALRGWSKDVQRAVYQSFNLVMHAITLAVYGATGLITARAGWMFLLVAPAMVLPSLLATRLYKRISEVAFRRLVLVLLFLSGAVLIYTAARELHGGG